MISSDSQDIKVWTNLDYAVLPFCFKCSIILPLYVLMELFSLIVN
uniref:Uncharacterized protein n=1 Tax=Rhizophora mucronata TaxID=61149 RepID=A0A2P2PV88_RHIMU